MHPGAKGEGESIAAIALPLSASLSALPSKRSDHHESSEELCYLSLQSLSGTQNLLSNGDVLLQPWSSFAAGTSMRVVVSDGLCGSVRSELWIFLMP